MIHSGDVKTDYGLRHIIDFSINIKKGDKGYIISAPWVTRQSRPITELAKTNPVFEVRTNDDNELKRYIIPHDFSVGGSKTACVNAEITYSNDTWRIVIKREFINGFADDMRTIVADLINMNKEQAQEQERN
jgi:hypothetical protein